MVAGDMASKDTATSSAISSSPNRRSVGTNSSMIGASRFPVGAPSTAQQNANASMTSGPYTDARGALGWTILGTSKPQRLPCVVAVPTGRRAQLVQHPPLRGLPRAFVPGRDRHRHRLLLRQRQSHHQGLTGRPDPVPQARPTRAFLRESTTPATRALLVSQCSLLTRLT